jgi:hypothetical protein
MPSSLPGRNSGGTMMRRPRIEAGHSRFGRQQS